MYESYYKSQLKRQSVYERSDLVLLYIGYYTADCATPQGYGYYHVITLTE